MEKMREIKDVSEMPIGVAYYSEEYRLEGNNHIHYENLYSADFTLIESAQVKYGNILDGLTRVVAEKDKCNIAMLAYNLTDLGNGFYAVERDGNTLESLESICSALGKF